MIGTAVAVIRLRDGEIQKELNIFAFIIIMLK